MRSLLALSLALVALPTAVAQEVPDASAERTAHVVPFGQTGNVLELVLEAGAVESLEAEVTLAAAPSWLAVRPDRLAVRAEPGEEAEAAFTFDVLPSAPAGEAGVLAFEVATASGRFVRHEIAVEAAAPTAFALGAPRPNPARGRVVVPVALPSEGALRVEAYDVLGRRVAVLRDGTVEAGGHEVRWDASRLAPGMYVVRAALAVEGKETQTEVRRLTVVR